MVRQYESENGGDRCHVWILDKYFQSVPQEAIEKDSFYVKPLTKKSPDPSKPWFLAVPIGKHTLAGMVKTMCTEAGLPVATPTTAYGFQVLLPISRLEYQRPWFSIIQAIVFW